MLTKLSAVGAVGLSCLLVSAAMAQSSPPTETTPTATSPAVATTAPGGVPKGTAIVVAITDLVSSETAKRDDMFNLTLAEPVMLNEAIVIPAGTPGKGQVIDAAKAGVGGKPGKLVLAARYLEFEGQQIPIKALILDLVARDESGTAAIIDAIAGGGIGGLVSGGQMVAPSGMRGTAKLAVNFAPGQFTDPTSTSKADSTAASSSAAQINTGAAPSSVLQTNSAAIQPLTPQGVQ